MTQFSMLVPVKGKPLHDIDIPFPESALGYQKLRYFKTDWHKALQMAFHKRCMSQASHFFFFAFWKLSSDLEKGEREGRALVVSPTVC